jgi:multidrug efflux pump subunit AcrA (membrane-fusion protein)
VKIPAKKKSFLGTKSIALSLCFFISISLVSVLFIWPKKNSDSVGFVVSEHQFGEQIQGYGFLRPSNEFSIVPTVQGVLVRKFVRPGDIVKKNEPLMQMQNIEIHQAFVAAEKEAISKISQQIRQLKNEYQLTKAKLELANAKLKANKELFAKKIISYIDLQQMTIEARQAELQYKAKEEELDDFISLKDVKLAVAKAELNIAEASLSVARNKYESLTIKAGSDGVVQSLNSDLLVGHLVNAGVGLGSIASTTDLFAELKVMANFASVLEVGQWVQLDIKGKIVNGNISHIEPNVVDNQIKILVDVDHLPDTARLNIEATGLIETSQRKALSIQRPNFIAGDEEFLTVERKLSDGSYKEQVVRLGVIDKEKIEILDGLRLHDQIKIKRPSRN